VVGTGTGTYSGDGGPATAASINNPCDVCIDNYGNILIADYFNARVRKVSPAGIITTFAGNGLVGYSGDGKRADTSAIGGVTSIYADASNNIYLASISNSIVIKVNPAGIMSTVAGVLGSYVYLNDNVPATSTPINAGAITMDRTGNLYICDQINNRVRKVDVHGIIQTIAGNGTMGSSGDGGPATAAELGRPDGVAVDTCGNVYIPEANTNRVRKVTYDTCSIPNSIATYQPKEVELYPNPVTSTLFVSFNEAGTWSLTLYDILGNTVATLNSVRNNADIDLSNVSPGVYVLRAINMNNGGNVLMKKIVKN
ncbi:MAG: T9SS type A sorting domain-containing protein, partial [Taibaiella sp.]|nr:T9SS type A sorting domain-containing protein [Taibaiella sp.]